MCADSTPLACRALFGHRFEEEQYSVFSELNAGPKGDNIYEWRSTILGPPGSVYEGGVFFLDITFSSDYPFKPPKLEMQAAAILEPFWQHCSVISLTAPHTSERQQGELCRNAKRSGAKITKGKTEAKYFCVPKPLNQQRP
ncbi:UNVERIFIED_CONTAM: hypothetical protein FKN15_000159 [Acipenser sinensis]